MHSLELANRALHLATMTLQTTKDWTSSSYVLEVPGLLSSCAMRRIALLDTTDEYIFCGNIRAVCLVQLQDGAVVVCSEDDQRRVFIRLNYKDRIDSIAFGVPMYTIQDKFDVPVSPTSVIRSSAISIVAPVSGRAYEKCIPNVFHNSV